MVQNIFRCMHQVYSLCHYSSVLGLGADRGNSAGEAPVHLHGQAGGHDVAAGPPACWPRRHVRLLASASGTPSERRRRGVLEAAAARASAAPPPGGPDASAGGGKATSSAGEAALHVHGSLVDTA